MGILFILPMVNLKFRKIKVPRASSPTTEARILAGEIPKSLLFLA